MNLSSLFNVKQWVGSTTTTDDKLLGRLLSEASRTALNYIQRPDIGLTTITETISGRGERKLQLRNWPVIAVNSLSVNGVTVPPSTGPTVYGYFLEPFYGSLAGRPQNLGIVEGVGVGSDVVISGSYATFGPGWGGRAPPFPRGVGNILANYSFGYCVQNEAQTIPSSGSLQIAPNQNTGSWVGDIGVSYAAGGSLTALPAGSSPSTGQYVVPDPDTGDALYTFASGDAGKAVLISYNYVPFDLEQACVEMVGERYKYKGRIGQASQTLGGQETSAYLVKDMLTAAIKGRLDPYRLGSAV